MGTTLLKHFAQPPPHTILLLYPSFKVEAMHLVHVCILVLRSLPHNRAWRPPSMKVRGGGGGFLPLMLPAPTNQTGITALFRVQVESWKLGPECFTYSKAKGNKMFFFCIFPLPCNFLSFINVFMD